MTRQQIIEPINKTFDEIVEAVAHPRIKTHSVFSGERDIVQPKFKNIDGLKVDERQKMDGLTLLKKLPAHSVPLVFFDPQYRSILDKQAYGNEGVGRSKNRAELPQMTDKVIKHFLKEIERILLPSGHLMLWVDKFIIFNGIHAFTAGLSFQLVDMITWNKQRMGMGYRTRRYSEYLVIFQKPPIRAKGVWRLHDIPDVWDERIENGDRNHIHAKPVSLQEALIKAVTNKGDIIVDPAAGGYSVLKAALNMGRHFIGSDIQNGSN